MRDLAFFTAGPLQMVLLSVSDSVSESDNVPAMESNLEGFHCFEDHLVVAVHRPDFETPARKGQVVHWEQNVCDKHRNDARLRTESQSRSTLP